MHHFFASPDQISEDTIRIGGNDYNHIRNVLRIGAEEKVSVYDGAYHEYICSLDHYEKETAVLKILEMKPSENELRSKLYLFQGLPKQDKMDLIIQKAVELGVHAIIPVQMHRCIVKYDEKKEKAKLKRWQTIAESAAKQSARAIIPEVGAIINYDDALIFAASLDTVFVPYEYEEDMARTKERIATLSPGSSIGIFIGPEGGFEDDEIQKARERGFETISLGRRILRTETAGLCALSVLMFALET